MPESSTPAAARPGAAVDAPWAGAGLDQLSSRDRALFQQYGQGPVRDVPYSLVHRAFEDQARARPLAVAAEHLGQRITYGELDRQADRLARLLAESGVRPGDRVAVFLRRSLPMLIAELAVLKAGAAFVPQDVKTAPAAQLRHVLDVTGARVVLTTAAYAKEMPGSEGRLVVSVDTLAAEPDPGGGTFRPDRELDSESLCYVLFTSGTTGRPNGVGVTHRNACNLLHTAPGDLGIRPGYRVSQLLNIGFDMAAWEIFGALGHGATLVIRGSDFAEAVRTADVVIATPTILATLDPARCERIKTVAVAGEPCPRPLADRWAAVGHFYNGCGPTETTIVNTLQLHDVSAMRLTIGRPTPNNTVYVLDDRLCPLPIGETGEMWAGGAGITVGYLNDPELTAERYRPDPFLGAGHMMFRTRDVGRWTPGGELEHLGRTDDQVKIRGFRVELDAVSAALESIPGCVRAATVKVDSRTLVSFVAPGHITSQEARRAVAGLLPYYCVPETVHAMEELPQTSRGKIDKAALLDVAVRLRAGLEAAA
ncbi:MAG: amino acid adenylation domain-containing protein [Catenulispora sp.]|nr:amino acid adenylation domain-containing protein [Catenulispora sp.]